MYTFKTIWCSGEGGVLNKGLYGEEPPRSLTPYPFEILKCRKTMWCTCKVVDFLIKPLTDKIFGILLEGCTWRFTWHSTLQAGAPIKQLTCYNLLSISKNIYTPPTPPPPMIEICSLLRIQIYLEHTFKIFKCFSLYGMSKLPCWGSIGIFWNLLFARIG